MVYILSALHRVGVYIRWNWMELEALFPLMRRIFRRLGVKQLRARPGLVEARGFKASVTPSTRSRVRMEEFIVRKHESVQIMHMVEDFAPSIPPEYIPAPLQEAPAAFGVGLSTKPPECVRCGSVRRVYFSDLNTREPEGDINVPYWARQAAVTRGDLSVEDALSSFPDLSDHEKYVCYTSYLRTHIFVCACELPDSPLEDTYERLRKEFEKDYGKPVDPLKPFYRNHLGRSNTILEVLRFMEYEPE